MTQGKTATAPTHTNCQLNWSYFVAGKMIMFILNVSTSTDCFDHHTEEEKTDLLIIANSVHTSQNYSTIFTCVSVCDQAWHLHLSPPYDVLDHTRHIFSESLSSDDDIDRDEDLQKDKYKDKYTQAQTKTNTKCFQDPIYTIFFISRGFKDLKYYIGCLLVMTKTKMFMHY